MRNTTLCYVFQGENVLLLHRNKKEADVNQGKWVGIGGKLEEGESPEEGMCREVLEETGLTLKDYRYRGIVTFVSDIWEGEYMHLFSATGFTGDLFSSAECVEGTLAWRPFQDLFTLPRWAGDDYFLRLLQQEHPAFFSLKLEYQGESLESVVLDGNEIEVISSV